MGVGYLFIAFALISYVYVVLFVVGYFPGSLIFVVLTFEILYRLYLILLLIAFSLMAIASLIVIKRELYSTIVSFIAGFGVALTLFIKRFSLNLIFQIIRGNIYVLSFVVFLVFVGIIPIAIFVRYGIALFLRKSKAFTITLGIGISLIFFLMTAFLNMLIFETFSRFALAVFYLFGSGIIYSLLGPGK